MSAGSDNVNHPSHYNQGRIEVIEYIEDKDLGFHLGNAVKYISRAGKKDPQKHVEDLKKAVWYLNREVEGLEAARDGRVPLRPNDMGKKADHEKEDYKRYCQLFADALRTLKEDCFDSKQARGQALDVLESWEGNYGKKK